MLNSNLQIPSEDVLRNILPTDTNLSTDTWLDNRENLEMDRDPVISAREVEDDRFST
jgi:hypothetical protein